ncbi:MKI67 FHA domain-interacting nucleolar phosphoprotein-like [Pieris brassicae]|uniref:MKI67 FHA domain-interacting nucleolar phosphoprotein-like n=1 Tax=Pieris brassicae TaxID=7116 RepID=UPI001E65ECFA|nr:MKI67 FHA domain-interacting nucleolar phosphoprotein-like [Pieris brassicae]
MEDSVALDSSKQKEFVKSVKGIKKLLKKKDKKVEKEDKGKEVIKTPLKRVKHGKIKKRIARGLVYLSHIPHGFYENEMSQYFRQFGMVTNVRVIRSKRTGNSKGYAFVEFKDPTVAQVVAETMNNYLMGKRLIKAVYIPPEKQKINAKRMHWTPQDNPTANKRRAEKKKLNSPKSEEGDSKAAKSMLKTLEQTKRKLKEIGIDYDFFKPVDIPEGMNYVHNKAETDEKNGDIKKEKSKDDKEEVKVASEDNKLDVKNTGKKSKGKNIKVNDTTDKKKSKVTDKMNNKDVKKDIKGKQSAVPEVKQEEVKKEKKIDKSQKLKKQKLEDLKVELLEDFINIKESDGDSDGSLEFDSDEFVKAMGEESFDSEDNSSDDESSANEEPAKIVIGRKRQGKKNAQSTDKKGNKNIKKQEKPVVAPKRKAEHKPIQTKKVKFEKQNNKKTLNKVIKKKK